MLMWYGRDYVVTREMLTAKFAVILPHLDERQRRLLLGAEARALGHGGIRRGGGGGRGPSWHTVSDGGRRSWRPGRSRRSGRVRRPGGGPQAAGRDRIRGCVPALLALVEPDRAGRSDVAAAVDDEVDPEPGRRADRARGIRSVRGHAWRAAARARGSACRPTPRRSRASSTPTGTPSSATSTSRPGSTWRPGQPVISVDTKKKELVGEYAQRRAGSGGPRATRSRSTSTTSPTGSWARRSRTGSTTWPRTPAG